MWGLWLIILTVLLFAIPLLPALSELIWPSDNEPLRVVQEYDRNIRHFAHGFRKYIDKNLTHLIGEPGREGNLADGTRFRTASKDGVIFPGDPEIIPYLIISAFPLTLPEGHFFESEVYSKDKITSGSHNSFRALMADGDITLKEHSNILRWVHANKQLRVEKGCALFGRASADISMNLAQDCIFERINAPIIEFGTYEKQNVDVARAQGPRTLLEELPRIRERYESRWLINGNVDFPAQHFMEADIIASKAMNVGAYAHIKGSIKSNDDCHIGAHVCIEGSAVSAGDMYVGPGCIISGPIIAEETISIAAGTIVGAPGRLTSITAPRIVIEPGAMVYGTIWAMEDGQVRLAGQALKKKVAKA
jgi:cytoskeletal protein CcmA (bactofilin family)